MDLKSLRINKNLTQEELASILNTNRTTISKVEKNNRIPTVDLLLAYSKEFEIPTDALLGLMDKYEQRILQEGYFKSKSYQDMVDSILDDFIERVEQREKLEDEFINNQWERQDLSEPEIELSLKNTQVLSEILEEIKKKSYRSCVILTNEEENILSSVLNLLIIDRNPQDITNLYLFINNIDKFQDLTKEIAKQNNKRLKIITELLQEFK